MGLVNRNRKFCYRIMHIGNLPLILQHGIVTHGHRAASNDYIRIGNPEIIDSRDTEPVRLEGYGNIGEYVPFYFTPRSMMLYNITTGYRAPVVPKRNKHEILVIRCLLEKLAELPRWFFTDGQGNDMISGHYNNLAHLDKIDWDCIQGGDFSKTDGDFDKARRYQAEFLVHQEVPVSGFESLHVYNAQARDYVMEHLQQNNINLGVHITPQYFFG